MAWAPGASIFRRIYRPPSETTIYACTIAIACHPILPTFFTSDHMGFHDGVDNNPRSFHYFRVLHHLIPPPQCFGLDRLFYECGSEQAEMHARRKTDRLRRTKKYPLCVYFYVFRDVTNLLFFFFNMNSPPLSRGIEIKRKNYDEA